MKVFDNHWGVPLNEIQMMGFDEKAVVRFDEFRVELNVLGLRNLLSPGLLPIKKAYIDFMLSSLVPPIAQQSMDKISTKPGPAGPNPTINSIISFNVPLPLEHIYAPSMACRVYDKCFLGFSAALVGVFTIPIGDLMKEQEEEYQKNIEMLDDKIEALTKYLDDMTVQDYQADNDKELQLEKEMEDKKFRDQQRKEKESQKKVFEADPNEKKGYIAKLTEEKKSATDRAMDDIKKDEKKQKTKPLLAFADDDDDEDGNSYTNPVAINDDSRKYVPPSLDISAINKSVDEEKLQLIEQTPRS